MQKYKTLLTVSCAMISSAFCAGDFDAQEGKSNVRSEFTYLKPEKTYEYEGYKPGVRAGFNVALSENWDIDTEFEYNQFEGETDIQFSDAKAHLKSSATFYDGSVLAGRNFQFGGFSLKPVIGADCTHSVEKKAFTEIAEPVSGERKETKPSPALGLKLRQDITDNFGLHASLVASGNGAKARLGMDATFDFEENKSFTIGAGLDRQARLQHAAIPTVSKDKYDFLVANGASVRAGFNF